VRRCKTRFAGDLSKQFKLVSDYSIDVKADLSLSLDVIFHLVEDSLFDDYMKKLFDSSSRYIIIYSSDSEEYPNDSHVRHRRFSAWIHTNRPIWVLVRRIESRYPYDPNLPDQTSFSDFFIYQKCST
jgi:hypothetical protein